MSKEQKAHALQVIAIVQKRLQTIEEKQNPRAQDLASRRQFADWQLCWLLEEMKNALPQEVQAGIQTRLDVTERIWNEKDQPAQKETSPVCLAAVDSF